MWTTCSMVNKVKLFLIDTSILVTAILVGLVVSFITTICVVIVGILEGCRLLGEKIDTIGVVGVTNLLYTVLAGYMVLVIAGYA